MAKRYEVRKREKNIDETVVAIIWDEPVEQHTTLRDIDQRLAELEADIAYLQREHEQLLADKIKVKNAIERTVKK